MMINGDDRRVFQFCQNQAGKMQPGFFISFFERRLDNDSRKQDGETGRPL